MNQGGREVEKSYIQLTTTVLPFDKTRKHIKEIKPWLIENWPDISDIKNIILFQKKLYDKLKLFWEKTKKDLKELNQNIPRSLGREDKYAFGMACLIEMQNNLEKCDEWIDIKDYVNSPTFLKKDDDNTRSLIENLQTHESTKCICGQHLSFDRTWYITPVYNDKVLRSNKVCILNGPICAGKTCILPLIQLALKHDLIPIEKQKDFDNDVYTLQSLEYWKELLTVVKENQDKIEETYSIDQKIKIRKLIENCEKNGLPYVNMFCKRHSETKELKNNNINNFVSEKINRKTYDKEIENVRKNDNISKQTKYKLINQSKIQLEKDFNKEINILNKKEKTLKKIQKIKLKEKIASRSCLLPRNIVGCFRKETYGDIFENPQGKHMLFEKKSRNL